jgi:cytochrome bd ubiquinol oxidase subunit I
MDLTALLLSRLQFAFTVTFHIIFPSFTIGLAAWLTVLEALHLWTGRPAYRQVFEFWLKIFGIAFGLGVVSGIVMAFQFGSNWSVLARMSGPIMGVLLSYETFLAFFLEASFFGILLFGRSRVSPRFYLFATAMVALGTTLSAFWILVNNSWMQAPVGYVAQNGRFIPDDWAKILLSPVLCAGFLPSRRASWCKWACISRPCWYPFSSFLDTSAVNMWTTTSRPKWPRSRQGGMTRSRLPRCCSRGRMWRSGKTCSPSCCPSRWGA